MKKLFLLLLLTPVLCSAQITKEEFQSYFPFVNIVDWKPGMKFITPPKDKIGGSWNLTPYKDHSDQYYFAKDYAGQEFTYEGLEERKVSCPRGKCYRTYLIFSSNGKKYQYEYLDDTTDMRTSNAFVKISNLTYKQDLENFKKLLASGKDVYVYTKMHPFTTKDKHLRIYTKVKLTGIDYAYGLFEPYKVYFEADDGSKDSFDVSLSGTNVIGPDDAAKSGYNSSFFNYFSFDNPRKDFPNIPDDDWVLITHVDTKIGMNKEEVMAIWGKPKSKNFTEISGVTTEQWVYGDDLFMYFKNGILSAMQGTQ